MATVIMKTKLNNVDPLDWLANKRFLEAVAGSEINLYVIYIYIYIYTYIWDNGGSPSEPCFSPSIHCKASVHFSFWHSRAFGILRIQWIGQWTKS